MGGTMESQIWSLGKADKYVSHSFHSDIKASIELNRIRCLLKYLDASFTVTYLHSALFSPIQPHLTLSPCEDLSIDRVKKRGGIGFGEGF